MNYWDHGCLVCGFICSPHQQGLRIFNFPALHPATLPSSPPNGGPPTKAHFAPPPRSWRRSASGLACVAGVCGHREVGNGQLFAAEAPLNAAADFGFAATGGKSQLSYWVYVGPNGGCKEHVWKWGANGHVRFATVREMIINGWLFGVPDFQTCPLFRSMRMTGSLVAEKIDQSSNPPWMSQPSWLLRTQVLEVYRNSMKPCNLQGDSLLSRAQTAPRHAVSRFRESLWQYNGFEL